MLQANFLKGHLMKRARMASRDTPHIQGNLERLLSLPTELIFEASVVLGQPKSFSLRYPQVFKHLNALDLYHMSLTCRMFKQALREPVSYPLWREAFAAIPSFPPCPTDLAEPQWADLMFGSVECEDCGRCGAQPDVALYTNLCHTCTEKHFVSKRDILQMFSSHPEPKRVYSKLKTVCQSRCRLVTLSLRQRSHERGTEKRWMRKHVEKYAPQILRELELEREEEDNPVDVVDASDPRIWRILRLQKISATNEHTMITLRWVVGILQELQDEHRKRTKDCLRRCRKRIENMNLGYVPEDISIAATFDWTPYFEKLALQKLTRKEFREHKDFLIKTVRRRAIRRLRYARKIEIRGKCESYRSTLPPREWLHFPPTREIMRIPAFEEYINQTLDRPARFPDAQAETLLPKFIADWQDRKRDELARRWMHDTGRPSMRIEDAKASLDLARTIFLCSQCKVLDQRCKLGNVLCGWDAALSHLCYVSLDPYFGEGYLDDSHDIIGISVGHTELEFSTDAEDVVVKLLEKLGLDPDTTTAKQMDDLDYRFFCDTCEPSLHRNGVYGKKAYTWKECVTHALQDHNRQDDEFAAFVPLCPDATRFVREHERLMYRPAVKAWGCAHCPLHCDFSVTLPNAITHVKEVHGIADPVQTRDVIRFDNRYSLISVKQRRPFVYSFAPLRYLKCKLCPEMKIGKLWDFCALAIHVREKHGAPVLQDAHYAAIQVVNTASTTYSRIFRPMGNPDLAD